MQSAASKPDGKRLSLFLKERWHWLFIAAAAALVLVRYMPAVYLSILWSDNIQAGMLFRDVVEQGHSMRDWMFTGHTDFFPDIVLVFLVNFLVRDGLLAYQIMASVFFAGWAISLLVLYRRNGGRNIEVFAALVILFFVCCSFSRDHNTGYAIGFCDSFATINHSGTEIVALVCLALCQHAALKGGRKSFWFLSALCFITAASDPLFMVIFPAPVLVALLIARLAYPSQIRLFLPLAGNIIASTALGFGLSTYIIPLRLMVAYTDFNAALALHSWHEVWKNCVPSVGGPFVIFVAVDLLCLVAGLYIVIAAFKPAAKRIPASIFLLLLYCACLVACDWGAAILTGDFSDLGTFRYVRFCFLTSALALIGLINHWIPWSKITGGLAVAGLSILISCIAIFSRPPHSYYYTEAQQLIPVMHSIMEKEHIEEGLSDYWFANLITFLSHDQVKLRGVNADGSLFFWLNNITWFSGTPPSTPAPKFGMIFMPRLSPEGVRLYYGAPDEIISALPGQDIWIYRGDKTISDSAIFGGLSSGPDDSVSKEFHVAASLLPSQTGTKEGCSIIARAGKDPDGAITYGPYLYPVAGRYLIKIAYAWLSAPAPNRVVTYDAVQWIRTRPVTLDAAVVPFVDTAPHELTREVRIPDNERGDFEARMFYHCSGDIRVDSLRIIYLGQ